MVQIIVYQYETAHGESNGHVSDAVTWPQTVKVVTAVLEAYISITMQDRHILITDHL